MTTTWQIAQIKRIPSTGLVIEVTYIMNFAHEGESGRHVGSVTLTGDPNDPNFVPYENLTEEVVTGWVQTKVGAEAISEIEARNLTFLQNRVNEKNNPKFLVGLPWDS